MKLKVNITKNSYSDWYYATYMEGRMPQILVHFQLSYTGSAWYFRMSERHNDIWITAGENGEFPVEYFKRLCQSIFLIRNGVDEFPEIELTVKAKKLLKIK